MAARTKASTVVKRDIPAPLDPIQMLAMEQNEFGDTPELVEPTFQQASEAILSLTSVPAEAHLSRNQSGNPRVGMRLGTYSRLAATLQHLDAANAAMHLSVAEMNDAAAVSERQKEELRAGATTAVARIGELEEELAAAQAAPAPDPIAAPAVDSADVENLKSKVAAYRAALGAGRNGGEALLAFDDVFLAVARL